MSLLSGNHYRVAYDGNAACEVLAESATTQRSVDSATERIADRNAERKAERNRFLLLLSTARPRTEGLSPPRSPTPFASVVQRPYKTRSALCTCLLLERTENVFKYEAIHLFFRQKSCAIHQERCAVLQAQSTCRHVDLLVGWFLIPGLSVVLNHSF